MQNNSHNPGCIGLVPLSHSFQDRSEACTIVQACFWVRRANFRLARISVELDIIHNFDAFVRRSVIFFLIA